METRNKLCAVSCQAVGCSSWDDPWTGSCLTVTCSSLCFSFIQIFHKPFDLSKNIPSFQVFSFTPPWYNVQCFGLGAFQSKQTPPWFSRWVSGWDQGKILTSSRFTDTALLLLVLKWGTQKIPTALKEASGLQCALSWQGMCGCALAFCTACEELHGDHSPRGQAKGLGAVLVSRAWLMLKRWRWSTSGLQSPDQQRRPTCMAAPNKTASVLRCPEHTRMKQMKWSSYFK